MGSLEGTVTQDGTDPFYQQFKYFYQVFRASGRLLYRKTKTGKADCAVFSLSSLYSICTLIGLTYCAYKLAFSNHLREDTTQTDYDKLVRYSLLYFYMSPQIFAVVFTPLESPKIVNYMNHWMQFNVRFKKVIGSPLPSCWTWFVPTVIVTSAITFGTIGLLEADFLLDGLPWYLSVVYVCLCFINSFYSIYWYFNCIYITNAGKVLSDSVVKTLLMNPQSQKVSDHRRVWLELCQLSIELSSSMYLTILSITATIFISFVFSCYGCLSDFLQERYSTFHVFLLPLILCIFVFLSYCDGAYKVKKKLGVDILEAILSCKFVSMKAGVHEEVELLLDTIMAYRPVIDLGGFFDIDRQVLVQIVSMSTTNLVVLLQFKVTAESPGGL